MKKYKSLLWLIAILTFAGSVFSQPTLPISLTTSLAGYPNQTFELRTDNYLYETSVSPARKYDGYKLTNISYELSEFPIIRCTRQPDGSVIAFDLTSRRFQDVLQTITVNGITYTLKADRKIFNGTTEVGSGAGVLRNENQNLLKVDKNTGNLFRFKGGTTWEEVRQIVTLHGTSYVVKPNNSLWVISPDPTLDEQIATNCKLILSNEKNVSANLFIQTTTNQYLNYDRAKKNWPAVGLKPVALSPNVIDPGIWFVLQNKSDLTNQNMALKVKDDGTTEMGAIPQTGPMDEFLWRTENVGGVKYLLNKKTGGMALNVNAGKATMTNKANVPTQLWAFTIANIDIHGTNAYTIKNNAGNFISKSGNAISLTTTGTTESQIWLAQPMDVLTGYRLSAQNGTEKYEAYNKILKVPNGPTIFGTTKVSEWSMLQAYMIVHNMLNALKVKPSGESLTKLNNHKIVVIGKDDAYPAVADYPIITGNKILGYYRGLNAGPAYTVFTEEMMCMNGVVNRFADFGERRFDHITHEFGHGMDNMLGWDGQNTIGDSKTTTWLNNQKVELIAISIQAWFDCNYPGSYSSFPQTRALLLAKENETPPAGVTKKNPYQYMAERFNVANTWTPPYRMRKFPMTNTAGNQVITSLKSHNGQYELTLNPAGNLCVNNITNPSETKTLAETTGQGKKLVMKKDGSLVILNSAGTEIWTSKTAGDNGAYLAVEDNGDVKIYWENPAKGAWEQSWPMSIKHFAGGGVYQIEGVKAYAGKYWTVTGTGPNDQLAFLPLPANATQADINKTLFKVVIENRRIGGGAVSFESVSNPGYFLYPIRPTNMPSWIIGVKPGVTDTDREFIVNGAITGVGEQFSLFPRKNQAWTVGAEVIRGIGFHMPGVLRYMPTYGDAGLIKGAFVAKESHP